MIKEEAQQFKARWKLVNDAVIEEVKLTPASVKLKQLAVMYEAGWTLGWDEALGRGEEAVRERWRRLKEKLHA